ncbi:hypothetical protein L207DRAFT_436222 [Hyaloscypha variabilis F]|uniref:Zn(2)-C6 fungal-type domain-containing protein n=1 Tax=Hyaloscypha variabilis (strain UAMH 11265 / GT02V1 / F) TaxID=1149755 RepID=A0A2J6R8U7_HYAVF|nr:hypothetical protein L207DRAFT_436222 [Hyaloscypha variabilis F]
MASTKHLTWINEDPDALQGGQSRSPPRYRPRAAHTKSRNGCLHCKLRRIKCDESRPHCGQCENRGVRCDFEDASTSTSQANSSTSKENTDESLKAQASAREWIESYLDHFLIRKTPCSHLKSLGENPANSIELLNHFFDSNGLWIGSPACQITMQQHCLQLMVGAPYLLHAVLAFSSSHLSFLHPSERRYRVTATFHYDLSLASYSSQISTGLDASNADSLLGCCYLHTMLAFRNLQLDDDSQEGNALTWLRTMQGTSILRSNLNPCLNNSVLHPLNLESRSWEEVICNHLDSGDSWASKASQALHQFCGVNSKSVLEENLYEDPLCRLCQLIQLEIGPDNIGMFMSFIGRLRSSFVELLDRNDPKAMMILCYWCALLSQIDQWWIVASATSECLRLCKLLYVVPDQRIQDLLEFPASKCGFTS